MHVAEQIAWVEERVVSLEALAGTQLVPSVQKSTLGSHRCPNPLWDRLSGKHIRVVEPATDKQRPEKQSESVAHR